MKLFINLFFITIATIYSFVKSVNAADVKNSNEDKFYMIFVENDYNENSKSKRQDVNESVYGLVGEIHNLIMNNTDTYEDPEKLFEIEKENKLKKRNEEIFYLMDHGESDIVYPISSYKDRTIVYAYLSNELASIVRTYPNVKDCIEDLKLNFDSVDTINTIENIDNIDNINSIDRKQIEIEIRNETNWKGVNIRENADLHLSLISQGKFEEKNHRKYDTSYYYPSSAGQDIDIYFIDTGFDFRYNEFSNKDEREAKCLYYISEGGLMKSPQEDYCYNNSVIEYTHGITTSDVAAGLTHGVANKANVYGIVGGKKWTSDLLVVLQYIKENRLRPNKTVFNLSFGIYLHNEKRKELINYWKGLIDSITEEGGIIIASAGNNSFGNGEEISHYPSAFENVISVAGVDIYGLNVGGSVEISNPTKLMKTKYYRHAGFSNYGKEVDIYAPGFSFVEYKNNLGKYEREVVIGTSVSSPIVAGVVATLMSENSDIKFDVNSMREYLWELGEKDILDDVPEGTRNIFINNGKHSIYPGDGDEETEEEEVVVNEWPSSKYDTESDSEYDEIPNDNNDYPSDYYDYPSEYYDYPSDYYYYPTDYEWDIPTPNEYVEPTEYVYQFEPHDWENDLDKYNDGPYN